ncbi:MAG: cobalamin B12-binding domain-containing protein [Desulfobacterales bacterium]|nr:cobalamin B12-binding domain-containing protein [Desulfobacterales bacterium]
MGKDQRKEKMKVLMARFSLDGHDRGLLSIMSSFRDAGIEVVYIYFSDPKELAKVAEEEDADVIGLTSSMGQHLYIASTLLNALNERRINAPVIIGGVIPTRDVPQLIDMGIKKVFGPGSAPRDAIDFVYGLSS